MDSLNGIEIMGYTASVFVAVSLMMKNIVPLRVVNFSGCFLFTLYGIAISAWPVAVMNGFGCLVNVYHLIKLRKENNRPES